MSAPARTAIAGALLLGLAACRDKEPPPQAAQGPGVKAVDPFPIAETDARMLAAKEMARVSVLGFIEAVRSPIPARSGFSVRTPGPGGEPVWLGDVTYDGHVFRGRVRNPPHMPAAAPGAEMKVKRADILDWLYVENGKLVGGFSVRALRDSLPPERRAELDKQLPFRVE